MLHPTFTRCVKRPFLPYTEEKGMLTQRKTVTFLLAVATFGAKALDPPSAVAVYNVRWNGIFVNFTKSEGAISCEFVAKGVFLSRDIHTATSNSTSVSISGLGSNIRYEVKGRCFAENGNASAFSTPKKIRTYPNGSKVVASRPLPHIFTVFLDPIPGARQWTLSSINMNTTEENTYVLQSPYKIFRDVSADTTYKIRARISRLKSKDISEAKSPFGDYLLVTTAKLSVFGRVVLVTQLYEAVLNESTAVYNSTIRKWEVELVKEYSKTQSLVIGVRILEFEAGVTVGTVAHHEIFVSGSTIPPVDSFLLNNRTLFSDAIVTEDVNPSYRYEMVPYNGAVELFFNNADNDHCSGNDQRNFILNLDDGRSKFIYFSSDEGSDIVDELTIIKFNKNDIRAGLTSTELHPNTLYTIDQSYLFKMCLNSDNAISMYSRRYTANFSQLGYNGTFVNSTGPPPMKTEGIPYRVSEDLTEITIEIEPVYRAQEYYFSIDGIQNQTLVDMDSSQSIELTLTGYSPSKRYCITMSVAINHPDWRTETSKPSCFPFYSGSPNATTCRVIEVTDESFRIIYNEVEFSTSYIVEITNTSFARNYTSTTNSFVQTIRQAAGAAYDVRVAAQNPFGISVFSETKTTKFWTFSDVSNSSMKLTWDNDTGDLFYDVRNIQINKVIRATTNEIVFNGLEEGVLYDINVTVVTKDGSSFFLFADRQITIPATPVNLTMLSNSKTSITVSWTKVGGVDFYTVNAGDAGSEINTSLTSVELMNLLPSTGYNIEVTAHNTAGSSLGIGRRFFTVFEKPKHIISTNTSSDGFALKWDGVDGAVNFQVSVSTQGWQEIFETVEAALELTGLIPSTSYTVTVTANFPDGSNTAEALYFVTAPQTPTNMTLVSRTSDSLRISWMTVANASSYDVVVNEGYVNKSVTSNSVQISQLSGGTVYAISVATVAFDGQRSDRLTNNYQTIPNSPEISVTNATQTTLNLTWNHPQGAETFRIILTSHTVVVKDELTRSNGIFISDLTAGTEYNINATSLIGKDHSHPPFMASVVTVCLPPSGLGVKSVTHNSFTLEWNPTRGADSYEVDIHSAERKRRSLQDGPKVVISSTTARVENLVSASRYNLAVAAVNSAGRSVSGSIVVGIGASNPIELRLVNVTTSSIVTEWDEQVGATNYRIFRTNSSGAKDTFLVGLNNNVELKNLHAGSSYTLELTTLSQIYPGPENFENKFNAPSITVITVPLPPTGINVTKIEEGNEIFVEWMESVGAFLYFVKIKTDTRDYTLNTTSSNITINADSDLRFTFTIMAMNTQNRVSAESIPVHYSLEDNTTGKRTDIPWWVFLIVSAVVFVILVSIFIWWKRRKPPKDVVGFYNVQNPDRQNNDDEVAMDDVQIRIVQDDGGYIGPQETNLEDEEITSGKDETETKVCENNDDGGGASSEDGSARSDPNKVMQTGDGNESDSSKSTVADDYD